MKFADTLFGHLLYSIPLGSANLNSIARKEHTSLRTRVTKLVSGLMLGVFLMGVAPKEYLHELLFDHVDTVDPVYKKGEMVITPKHIHCAFLGFVFAPFVATARQSLSFREVTVHTTTYIIPADQCWYSPAHHVASLRGPPYAG